MPNDAYTQQRLGDDPNFRLRVKNALAKVAWEVLNESADTPNHGQRFAYAQRVIDDPVGQAARGAQWLPTRTNLQLFETSYNFPAGAVVIAAGDADIESQLRTDWDQLS